MASNIKKKVIFKFMFLCQNLTFPAVTILQKNLEEQELNIAQSHDPSVPVGESMRLCSCAQYCALKH